ncbi:MAG: polysaccharide deacetylase family protein [Deltaproteobacteria bacterium]|nr:polysaccharide deacetylase family protein [Deltaproteobacteria bacterium]
MQSNLRTILSSVGLEMGRVAHAFRQRPSVRILYYHSVSDLPVRSSVAPEVFAAHMEHLSRHDYRVLSLTDAVQCLQARSPLPLKSVVLTFDDGFVDNYEQAFPILTRYKFPATVFLATSYIGSGCLPTLTRTEFVPQPLTWEQVKEMHAGGVEFGSHTLTHPMLSQVSPEQVRQEVRDSKCLMEDILGAPVRFFCYPRGDFSAAVRQTVQDEGYAAACTIRPGVNDASTDLFTLKRTYMSRRDTLEEFAKKMTGAYDLLQLVEYLWRQVRRA